MKGLQLENATEMAPVFRFVTTGSTRPPTRLQYASLLRRLDRIFVMALSRFGASTWAELMEGTKMRDRSISHLPSKATVEDWLALAERRGLVKRFAADGRGEDPMRWALTKEGMARSRRRMRRFGSVLRTVGTIFITLTTLLLGSTALTGPLGKVDAGTVVASSAFQVSVEFLVFASILYILVLVAWRVRAKFVASAIELSRIQGNLPSLDIDAGTLARRAQPADFVDTSTPPSS